MMMYAFSSFFEKNGQNFQMLSPGKLLLSAPKIHRTKKTASYSGGFPYQQVRFFWFQVKPGKVVPLFAERELTTRRQISNQVWVDEGNA